jgi:anthranilate synthase component 2
MKILVLDNYDSFTYNLVHILQNLDVEYEVHLNDKITLGQAGTFDAFILSPGPGIPGNAGIMPGLIDAFATQKPMLGVCLGHQALAEYSGATLHNMPQVYHGIQSVIRTREPNRLFRHIPDTFHAGRYHSWEVSRNNLPPLLRITAEDTEGCIMAFEHDTLPLCGVQFHPESIMTEYGHEIIRNYIEFATQFR